MLTKIYFSQIYYSNKIFGSRDFWALKIGNKKKLIQYITFDDQNAYLSNNMKLATFLYHRLVF